MPSSHIFWIHLKNGWLAVVSLKYGAEAYVKLSPPMIERMINTAICPRVMLSSGQNRRGAEAQPSVIARARRNPIASKNGYGSGTSAKVSGAARWVTVNG